VPAGGVQPGFLLTAGRFSEEFEATFAEKLGVGNALLVNSGSSPTGGALCVDLAQAGVRRLKPGDEVVTWPPRSHHRRPMCRMAGAVFVDVNLAIIPPSGAAGRRGRPKTGHHDAHTLGCLLPGRGHGLARRHDLW